MELWLQLEFVKGDARIAEFSFPKLNGTEYNRFKH
jgi:hypothetical protein